MHLIVRVIMVGAMTTSAASSQAQTQTKPPPRPASAVKPAAAVRPAQPVARPLRRHPVCVPAPPVIELDEMAVVPDLPTVLGNEDRDRYRRIFQAQAGSQWAQADAEIAQLTDKTLMGYVGAQRYLATGYPARYDQLAAWLQD